MKLTKYILLIIFIVFSFIGAHFTYGKIRNAILQERIFLVRDLKVITEGVVATNKIISDKLLRDELDRLFKDNADLKAYIKSTNARVTEVGKVVTEVKQTVNKKQSSDHSYVVGNENDQEFIDIKNKDDVPVAWAIFLRNRPESPWKSGTYGIEYTTDVVVMKDNNDDSEVVANTYMSVDKAGFRDKKIPVKVKSFSWVEEKIKVKSFMTNPNLTLGVNNTLGYISPIIDLGLFSYGTTKKDIDFRFVNIGIGYSDEFIFGIDPIQYNLGNYIPIVKNLFIGAGFYSDQYFNYNIGLHISTLF